MNLETKNATKTKILCVLDGFGLRISDANNSVAKAKMPNFRNLLSNYPWTTLMADGESVGQEAGLVGNSEVGHMNLGAGRLIPQLSFQITKSAQNSFKLDNNLAPDQLIDPEVFLIDKWNLETNKSNTVHLVGLFSTGTIHSDLRHWIGAIEVAGKARASKIVLHLISDGRDSDRQSLGSTWDYFLETFKERLLPFEDKIFLGSLGGRFYAMDRDNNWDRVKKGLGAILNFKIEDQVYKKFSSDTNASFDQIKPLISEITVTSYADQIFDESIYPNFISNKIEENDTVWLLNFRTDRMKQLSQMLCDLNQTENLGLTILSMNDYGIDPKYKYFPIFKNKPVQNTLAEQISSSGKTQLHLAETEKYNHVTYFFNGGQNQKWAGEDWMVIPSNKVNSHAEKPEMKTREVTQYLLENGLGKYDYIVVNYAAPDMVGHTGDIAACILALEVLDMQLGLLIKAVEDGDHTLIITADHGNVEFVGDYLARRISPFEVGQMLNLTDTEHNPNPVPFILVTKNPQPEILTKYDLEYLKDLNLENPQSWLLEAQIPKPKLPLSKAGELWLKI